MTCPRGTGGGSNPTGGEYTEKITGRVMQGIKEFFAMGGGGGAGIFSLTEWIMKGSVWPRAAALRGAWIPDGAEEFYFTPPQIELFFKPLKL